MELEELKRIIQQTIEPEKKLDIAYIIGDRFIKIGKFEEGIEYLLQNLELAEKFPNKNYFMDFTLLISQSYIHQNKFELSLEYLHRLLNIAQKEDNELYMHHAYNHFAIIDRKTMKYQSALNHYFRAIEIIEDNHDEKDNLVMAYCHIGSIYIELKRYQIAIDYVKKAIKADKKRLQLDYAFYQMGIIYNELGNYTLAFGYMKRALNIVINTKQDAFILKTCNMICSILLKAGENEKILKYSQFGLEYVNYSPISDVFTLYCTLGCFHTQKMELDKAETYFNKVLNAIDNIHEDKHLLEFYKVYSDYLVKKENFHDAHNYQTKYNELRNKIYDEEIMKNLAIKMTEFEYEQKKIEAKMLAEKNSVIEQKNNELQKLHDEKVNLLNTISHDLRNCVGAVKQAIELYTTRDETLKENKYIKICNDSIEKALKLVQEIVSPTYTANLQLCDINEEIEKMASTLIMLVSDKKINVKFEYSKTPLMVKIDKDKWHRIFENLTTNAKKFTDPEGLITISTSNSGKNAIIKIKDSGIGIPENDIPKLFIPRSGVGRPGTSGEESIGLGLSIVKKLIQEMNGTIDVVSEVNIGSEFIITFPNPCGT